MMLEIRKSLPTVQKKACILRKLILGCRKVSFPKLLEEVSDYISVLKMQVQAMKALVDVLATSASSPAPIGLSKCNHKNIVYFTTLYGHIYLN